MFCVQIFVFQESTLSLPVCVCFSTICVNDVLELCSLNVCSVCFQVSKVERSLYGSGLIDGTQKLLNVLPHTMYVYDLSTFCHPEML